MPDDARYLEVAREAYWLLAWTWQSHLFDGAKPFEMSVFAPEAYTMMNESERCLYRALCRVSGHKVPEEPANVA